MNIESYSQSNSRRDADRPRGTFGKFTSSGMPSSQNQITPWFAFFSLQGIYLAAAFFLSIGVIGEQMLSTLPVFEDLRANAAVVNRTNNVDIFSSPFAFCHLITVLPFSFFPGPERVPFTPVGILEGSLAVLLAAEHLNNGDGSIISEVDMLNETCNIRFSTEMVDNELSEYTAVSETIKILNREPGKDQLPCAFLGNGRSAVTAATSIMTGIFGYPQISPLSTMTVLDNKNQYKLFGRLITSDDGTAIPAILYLYRHLKVSHLAVIYNNEAYGNAYAIALQKAARDLAPEMRISAIDVPFRKNPDDFEKGVRFLKSTKYRYFFAIVEGSTDYEPLMIEAYRQGIAGTGKHNWMFSDSVSPGSITEREHVRGSPLHLASKGASTLAPIGGTRGMPVFDKFVRSWKKLNNANDIDYIKFKHPQYPGEPDYVPQVIDDDFFASPGWTAPFLYDSTIALGLAACNVSQPSTFFNGSSHYGAFLQTEFEGATGPIILDKTTGTRDPKSALFQLTNYIEVEAGDGKIKFAESQSDVFRDGKWTSLRPYIFNDGSTTAPYDLPLLVVDRNYVGTGMRVAGLVMAGLIILASAIFAFWTRYYRNSRVVKASQPFFLNIICFGTLLMGSAIIPLSFDEEIVSKQSCSAACMAVPWLLSVGFAFSFAALFSKTWRVNRIFHNPAMTRVKITIFNVLAPLIAFSTVNITILSVWTALAPLKWERCVVDVDEFNRVVESYGHCTSDSTILPYVISLLVINLGLLTFALYQAYVARDISTEFAESEYISKALASSLLVCFIGVPLMIIDVTPAAHFFVLACIIFVLCMSLLLFMFIPKVKYHRGKYKGGKTNAVKDFVSHNPTTTQHRHSADSHGSVQGTEHCRLTNEGKDVQPECTALKEEKAKLEKRISEIEILLEATEGSTAMEHFNAGNPNKV